MRRKSTGPSSNDGEDRISRLPNALIHHILSFMDMKYVVQTSVLSKRWIDVWTTMSTLNFNSYQFLTRENGVSEIQIGSFANFINEIFILRGDSSINKFHVDWNEETHKPRTHTIPISNHMNTWIIAAVRHAVQDLSVQIRSRASMILRLPHCLLNSQSLTKLVLKHQPNYTKISLPNSMSLPRLKLLSLSMFYVEEVKLLNELISSCPVLESLILANISVGMGDDVNLNIESRDLKHFYLHSKGRGINHPRHTMAKVIKLSTPNLTSLICHDYMIQEYFLENLSSLVTAKIKMTKENDRDLSYGDELSYLERSEEEKEDLYPKRMMKMLRALHNMEKLTLSASFVQVLSKAPGLTQCQPPQFHSLQWLKLTTCLTRGCLAAITYLLKISPKLESLILMSKECQ
ncbi:F-box/LRR-repeat protein At3g58930-like isoform X2 [Papaver somniferum]|uniref:F-box/LRR-repeat protein At3g58930-like isoform X2 n=1 Tax=Papaver somniferum TaxID=3469 RepID=UPI000E6FF5E8|nr:F-box/LRR-repeat protein At3g58930-like isoform X2 [Papaver somniferum]